MSRLCTLSILFLSSLLLIACGEQQDAAADQFVTVYTHRHYDADKTLFTRFEAETGIRVELVKGKADELIQRLETEGELSPADLLISVDAGRMHRAMSKGLLQPVTSEILDRNVPSHLRDPQNHWYGLTRRARVIVYAKDRVDPAGLSTYQALTGPEWKGRILLRSSQNIYNQSLVASMIAHQGRDAALSWCRGMVANFARSPKGNDRDQMKAIAAGVGDVALVNTYYLGKLHHSSNEAERDVARKMGVFFPNQDGRGTHINVSGAGLTRHAPHRENAIRLLEFLSSEPSQALFASGNYEYPVKSGLAADKLLQSWGDFKADRLELGQLGVYNSEAVKVFDEAGWR